MRQNFLYKLALLSSVCFAPQYAYAQTADQNSDDEPIEEIQIIGSQIKGANVADTLPVSVVNSEDINLTGATTGDELFRSIPQIGFVAFNETNVGAGVNAARGDVSSINLRGIGTGNTLTLLNGRRLVLHPGFQTENLVPVVSVNTNTIPTFGLERVEVLRDGAAAIYGADAVAGVVNNVLRDDFEGLSARVRYGFAENTGRDEITANISAGTDFNEGRSHISFFASYHHRDAVEASELPFSASSDRRPFLVGTPFEGDTQFRNSSINSPFGRFRADIRIDELGDDDFHIQPASGDFLATCLLDRGDGVCIDNGTSLEDPLRFDFDARRTLSTERDRVNTFAYLTHELDDGSELYSELAYYYAEAAGNGSQGLVLTSQRFNISNTAFFNPFGATTLPDGSPNPNRIQGLTNVPDEGVNIEVRNFRPVELGPRFTTVTDESFRALLGYRGNWGEWDFDTAVLYSEATTEDLTNDRISLTLFQQAIERTDATAFNPFAGGSLTDLEGVGTFTPNDPATLDSFRIDVRRDNKSTLFLADFKLSNANVFELPAGSVGFATGVEARREGFEDDRDDRLDGTITFTDIVTGQLVSDSDVLGSSPTPDTSGSRWVGSAFAEFAVPVVSPEMDIPLVQSLDLQIAGRYENFEFSGDTFRPKVAASWVVNDDLLFRGAWSLGFRAPNLVQIFDTGIRRVNTREDLVICQAQVDAGDLADLGDCPGQGVESVRSGSADLENEDTTQWNAGVVLTPTFAPGLTITADYWRVEQRGVVGIFGDQNQIALDLLLRQQGSFNPNVVREADVDPDLAAVFAASGLAPAGDIIEVRDPYQNLSDRTIEGLDFAVLYDFDTDIGQWSFKFNAAHLLSFEQDADAQGQLLLDANIPGVEVAGIGDLLEQNGRPQWRFTSGLNWRNDNWGAGLFGQYVGGFDDTSADITVDGERIFFRVDDVFTLNGNISYEFNDADGLLEGTRIQFGVNNIFDTDPPLADENFGFFGSLHSAVGRFFFFDISKNF
ncbi:TonB-dependent siderophore receptor [Kordiimonas sp. SCSIO 12610]|uniref:TonB-dependent receptor plug domain-containing protein n=1 Tax=Kordiimonas sp. SCSIO 12610 TaxID=2829597 RepID=UPI00210D555C|nr:TonB-dependent receptor [Kordiimonas sp. SCSIO 12610]UTW53980.1 TonB-dependent receptor [Kordiimonas sp. SCSIO 12610]